MTYVMGFTSNHKWVEFNTIILNEDNNSKNPKVKSNGLYHLSYLNCLQVVKKMF